MFYKKQNTGKKISQTNKKLSNANLWEMLKEIPYGIKEKKKSTPNTNKEQEELLNEW